MGLTEITCPYAGAVSVGGVGGANCAGMRTLQTTSSAAAPRMRRDIDVGVKEFARSYTAGVPSFPGWGQIWGSESGVRSRDLTPRGGPDHRVRVVEARGLTERKAGSDHRL